MVRISSQNSFGQEYYEDIHNVGQTAGSSPSLPRLQITSQNSFQIQDIQHQGFG